MREKSAKISLHSYDRVISRMHIIIYEKKITTRIMQMELKIQIVGIDEHIAQ